MVVTGLLPAARLAVGQDNGCADTDNGCAVWSLMGYCDDSFNNYAVNSFTSFLFIPRSSGPTPQALLLNMCAGSSVYDLS